MAQYMMESTRMGGDMETEAKFMEMEPSMTESGRMTRDMAKARMCLCKAPYMMELMTEVRDLALESTHGHLESFTLENI